MQSPSEFDLADSGAIEPFVSLSSGALNRTSDVEKRLPSSYRYGTRAYVSSHSAKLHHVVWSGSIRPFSSLPQQAGGKVKGVRSGHGVQVSSVVRKQSAAYSAGQRMILNAHAQVKFADLGAAKSCPELEASYKSKFN